MDILDRLKDACVGTPAKIAWPHRLLHDAIKEIEECHENINIKADFIEATINDMAHIDSRLSDLREQNKALERGNKHMVDLLHAHGEPITPEWFGAVPDGQTDCTEAFKMYDAAQEATTHD